VERAIDGSISPLSVLVLGGYHAAGLAVCRAVSDKTLKVTLVDEGQDLLEAANLLGNSLAAVHCDAVDSTEF